MQFVSDFCSLVNVNETSEGEVNVSHLRYCLEVGFLIGINQTENEALVSEVAKVSLF